MFVINKPTGRYSWFTYINLPGMNLVDVILPTMKIIKREFDFWGFIATRRFHGISLKDVKTLMTSRCFRTRISSICGTVRDPIS